MEFLAYQLSTSYKTVWATLLGATSVREASDAVLLKFERPADHFSGCDADPFRLRKENRQRGRRGYDSVAAD
jgi:hypothetical protein